MTEIGERVWWWHTENNPLFGTVAELDDRPGIKPDNDPDLLYLDEDQLHRGPLPDGVYPTLGYHSAPERLSPSGAKKLLQPGGPKKFDYARTHPKKPEPKFDMGKLVHRLVLGAGEEVAPIIGPDPKTGELVTYGNYNTKAAQAIRDKAYADGMIPALQHQIDTATEMARVVHEHPEAGPLLSEGEVEGWLYATDPVTGQKIRTRPDCWTWRDGRVIFSDVKTSGESVDSDTFERKAYKFGYHLQLAFNIVAANALWPGCEPGMVLIAQELDPPYDVNVLEYDARAFTKARQEMTDAIVTFQHCTKTKTWPGHQRGIETMSLPNYAFYQNQTTISDLLERADEQ